MRRRAALGLAVLTTLSVDGTGLYRNAVPAQTQELNRDDLRREGMPNLLQSLDRQAGGVTLGSASGNPFQPTLFYRGLAASPLHGGLRVAF